jgi:hypothetical protein
MRTRVDYMYSTCTGDTTKELAVKTKMQHGEGKSENNPTMRSDAEQTIDATRRREKRKNNPTLQIIHKTRRGCKWRRERHMNNPTTRSQRRNTRIRLNRD